MLPLAYSQREYEPVRWYVNFMCNTVFLNESADYQEQLKKIYIVILNVRKAEPSQS